MLWINLEGIFYKEKKMSLVYRIPLRLPKLLSSGEKKSLPECISYLDMLFLTSHHNIFK